MMRIDFATPKDAQEMAVFYGANFPEHMMVRNGILTNADYLTKRLIHPDERWVVSKDEDEIVGSAALTMTLPIRLAEIERVCVKKELRGRGIAFDMCKRLIKEAIENGIGFLETFARGNQPAMQRTFEKLGFRVYGIAPRFEVMHDGQKVREQYVHMGIELKPETIDDRTMQLIPAAQQFYDLVHRR